jgi:hypothetical protein
MRTVQQQRSLATLLAFALTFGILTSAPLIGVGAKIPDASTTTPQLEQPLSTSINANETVINCNCATTESTAGAANEVMVDRCSAAVAIPPSYDGKPGDPGTVVLMRGKDGKTDWTPPFTVKLGPSGHIRWWCNSTKGNWADPGTWRIQGAEVGVKTDKNGDLQPTVKIKLTDSSWQGWTPERSRCDNRSTKIRARLGPDRLLQVECLGK